MSNHTAEIIEQEIQETRQEIVHNVQELESTDGKAVFNTLLHYGKKSALNEVQRLSQKASDQLVRSSQNLADRSHQYPLMLAGLGLLAGYLLTKTSTTKGNDYDRPR